MLATKGVKKVEAIVQRFLAIYTPNRPYPGKKRDVRSEEPLGYKKHSCEATEILPEIDEISARDQEELSQFVDEGLEGGLPSDGNCTSREDINSTAPTVEDLVACEGSDSSATSESSE